jgi:hypothetical protein
MYKGASLYVNNEKITDLTIPKEVTKIGSMAFYGCNSLETVVLHQGVEEIESNAFFNCTSIRNVYCQSNTPPRCGSFAFHYYNSYYSGNRAIGCYIHVPIDSVDAYKTAWSEYADNIIGYDFE